MLNSPMQFQEGSHVIRQGPQPPRAAWSWVFPASWVLASTCAALICCYLDNRYFAAPLALGVAQALILYRRIAYSYTWLLATGVGLGLAIMASAYLPLWPFIGNLLHARRAVDPSWDPHLTVQLYCALLSAISELVIAAMQWLAVFGRRLALVTWRHALLWIGVSTAGATIWGAVPATFMTASPDTRWLLTLSAHHGWSLRLVSTVIYTTAAIPYILLTALLASWLLRHHASGQPLPRAGAMARSLTPNPTR